MLAKDKLNVIEVLISKDLTDSYITHDVLKEYDDMKEVTKYSKNFNSDHEYAWFINDNNEETNNINWIFVVLIAQILEKRLKLLMKKR